MPIDWVSSRKVFHIPQKSLTAGDLEQIDWWHAALSSGSFCLSGNRLSSQAGEIILAEQVARIVADLVCSCALLLIHEHEDVLPGGILRCSGESLKLPRTLI